MGASITDSFSRDRHSNDSAVKSDVNSNATFNSPQGQQLLGYLTGASTSGNSEKYIGGAADAYSKQAAGTNNPEVENIIKSSNYEGNRAFGGGMAKLRAQGYRGGTAANIFNQGTFADDYAAKLAGQNANTRYSAFNDSQNRSLAGASGLAGLGTSGQSLAAQILALLRGESKDAVQIGHGSGTDSGHTVTGKASYGTA